jgi:hypothetical protein
MPVRHSQSLELRLKSEGKLDNAIRRAAFPLAEKLYHERGVEMALWREEDAAASNILDEESQRLFRTSAEANRERLHHDWVSSALTFMERDKEISAALAERAARRGDRELPESMIKPRPINDMQRCYAGFEDTVHYNPNIEPPTYSRLQLRDPSVPERRPPSRFGEARHMTSVHPVPAAPPRPDVLSMAELSKRLLPTRMQIPDDKPVKPDYAVGRSNREAEVLKSRGTVALPDPNRRW